MKYIVKNIRNFIKEESMVFVFLCLSIICSVAVLHAAYGIYCAINRHMLDALYGTSELTIFFSDSPSSSQEVTKEKLLKVVDHMDQEIIGGLEGIVVDGWFPEDERIFENQFEFIFRYQDGKIMCYEQLYDNLIESNLWKSGSYFTKKQYEDGELVAVFSCGEMVGDEPQWGKSKYKPEDGYVVVDNKKYKEIGFATTLYTPMIPFTTVREDFVVDWVCFGSVGAMKRREYEVIADVIRAYFPDVEIPPYPVPDADETMVYKSIMVICVLIVVISALVYAVLYQYVIERRKRMLDIFRVSGLSLSSAQHIYMGECVLLLAVCYGVALVLFRYFLQPFLQGAYFYIGEVFSLKAYAILGVIYFAVVYLILRIKVWHSFQKARMIERI